MTPPWRAMVPVAVGEEPDCCVSPADARASVRLSNTS